MTKNLKEVLQEYRLAKTKEEKDFILGDVFGYEIKEVLSDKKDKRDEIEDIIYKLKFKIPSMQKAYNHVKNIFRKVNEIDLESYVSEQVTYIFEKGNVNFTYEERQIEVWFLQTLEGRVHNQIIKEYKKTKNEVSEQLVNREFEEVGSRFDDVAIKQFEEVDYVPSFDKYIELVGGYQKILSPMQFEVYILTNYGMTQKEIAEKLNCKQQNVQKHLSSASKRIANKYMEYRTLFLHVQSHNTTENIRYYLHTYKNILKFDLHNTFDYFGFTYDYLGGQYDSYNTYDDKATTVLDVIFDRLKAHESDLFNKLEQSFNNPKITFTGRERERILKITNKIFEEYIDEINHATINISGVVINKLRKRINKYSDYDEFIDIISQASVNK